MQAETFEQVYDIEYAIEKVVAQFISAQEIACVPPDNASDEFQKKRPRIEIEYVHSDPYQSNHTAGPYYRSRLFVGQLNASIITNANNSENGGMAYHRQIRAKLRNIMAKLSYDVTALADTPSDPLPYHTIEFLKETATSPRITPQDGVLQSDIIFEFQVNVRPDAWPDEEV